MRLDEMDFTAGVHGMTRVRAKTVKGESWEPKTKVNWVVPINSKFKNYLETYLPPGV